MSKKGAEVKRNVTCLHMNIKSLYTRFLFYDLNDAKKSFIPKLSYI